MINRCEMKMTGKKISQLLFVVLLMAVCIPLYAAKGDSRKLYGKKPFFLTEGLTNYISWNKTYKLNYDLNSLRNQTGECVAGEALKNLAYAGRGSIFHVNTRHDKDDLVFIEFEYVAPAQNPPAKIARAEINKPYYLCKDKNITSPNYYRQVGGVSTGIAIVPMKIRNDLTFSGDSTIGPYVGMSGENFSLLGLFGFSQLTVPVTAGSDELETRTGLSVAVGINWKVRDFFNLGIVGGIDHVAGDAGSRFAYQNAPWGAFMIGYSFTD